MSTEFLLLLIFIAAISVPVIILLITQARKTRYESFVHKHSTAIKTIKALNEKYRFHILSDLIINEEYDNESFFTDILPADHLTYRLIYNQDMVLDAISRAEENNCLHSSYLTEISSSCTYGKYDVPSGSLNRDTLIKLEKNEFLKHLKKPSTDFSITIVMTLNRMNGSYVTSKRETFYPERIKDTISRLRRKSGDFYLDEDIWNSICRVERGKVTNKMRFAIYARDGHRCRICGLASENLEIDHIFPVSKGGKSTPGNLQTLCRRCNLKKSSSVQYHSSIPKNMRTEKPEFCPKCASPLLLRKGNRGNFLGCSDYPNCKYTKQL